MCVHLSTQLHDIAVDIDECTLNTDECSDNSNCTDTEGSYNCTCDVGYVLQDDLRTCLRKCDVLLAVLYSVTCLRLSNVVFNNFAQFSMCTAYLSRLAACPTGSWGQDCAFECNCRNASTVCDTVTGCTACADGFMREYTCTKTHTYMCITTRAHS